MENIFERKPFISMIGVGCALFFIVAILTGSYIIFITNSPEYNTSYETFFNIFSIIINFSPLMSASIGAVIGFISKINSKSLSANYTKTLGLGLVTGLLGYLIFLFPVFIIINYVSPGTITSLASNIEGFWLNFLFLTASSAPVCAISTIFFSFAVGYLKRGRI